MWDADIKMMVPVCPTERVETSTSKGVETNRVLAGKWLISDFKGEMFGSDIQEGHGTSRATMPRRTRNPDTHKFPKICRESRESRKNIRRSGRWAIESPRDLGEDGCLRAWGRWMPESLGKMDV